MLIYNYNEDGFFTGTDEADESPLEPGVFLLPALATIIAPPNLMANQKALFDGEAWVAVDYRIDNSAGLAYEERQWRDWELVRADRELNKVQDGMGTGTVSAWRSYRCSLRNWPADENFPEQLHRPVAPDAI